MTTRTMLRVFSVQEASVRFEEIFDAASRQPVEIAAEEGRAAYLVSKQDFDAMVATVEELTDQLWLVRAELARKGGFVGTDEVESMLTKLESVGHAETDAHEKR